MQIHELPTGTLGDSDYAAIDNGSTNRKLSLKSAINSLITSGISAIQSALTTAQNNITSLQNSMSTANSNITALQTKVGSASTVNVGDGSLAGAVGNTVMGTTATTLSGAVKEHEDQIGNTDITGVDDGTITGAIDMINSSLTGSVTSYTPSFTVSSGTNPTVGNITFRYFVTGTLMVVSGRFNMTAVGSVGSSNPLRISLPGGYTYVGFNVGCAGMVVVPDSNPKSCMIRNDSGDLYITNSSGSAMTLSTGYYAIMAFVVARS